MEKVGHRNDGGLWIPFLYAWKRWVSVMMGGYGFLFCMHGKGRSA